jgi:anti-sigma factor RsiW
MPDPSPIDRPPHDEAEELLPWYATGQLEAAERARVEAHLYACAACREQLAIERRFMGEFRATSPEVESGWARLKARIDPPRPAPTRAPTFLADLRALVSRPAVAALAAAQLAFVVVAGGALVSLSRPAYHALGSAPVPADANLIVMFRADASEDDIRGALQAIGATIVGGPTSADAYLLHVAPQRREAALTRLQSNDYVQLAQPIDGVGS